MIGLSFWRRATMDPLLGFSAVGAQSAGVTVGWQGSRLASVGWGRSIRRTGDGCQGE